MKKIWVLLALAIFFTGCATIKETSGTSIQKTTLSKIIKGKTTTTDILTWFGPPNKIIYYSVLNKQNIKQKYMVYVYEYIEKGSMTFAKGYPIANERVSENKNTLLVWIDRNTGIVKNYIYQQGIPTPHPMETHKPSSATVNTKTNITP